MCPEVRRWAKRESGNRVLQGNGKVCGGTLRPYLCHSKELSVTWAGGVQAGHRTYHRGVSNGDSNVSTALESEDQLFKGRPGMLRPPERRVSRKLPPSVGWRGQGVGCGVTGILWETAQEGGLLGGSWGGEGCSQNPRTKLRQGGSGEGCPWSFFLLPSDLLPAPSTGWIQNTPAGSGIFKAQPAEGTARGRRTENRSSGGAVTV